MSDHKPGADPDPDEAARGDEAGADTQYAADADSVGGLDGAGVGSQCGEDVEDAAGPPVPGVLVLGVVGVLAGFVMVGLVWVSERGCDRVRDSPNCGAAGFPLLVLAVVVTVVLAAVALSRLGMPNPKLVAFLGVGFMLLVVLGFLSDDLFSTWTLLVVPVLTAITFLLAHLIAGRLERADA